MNPIISTILKNTKTIAIVGLSSNLSKPSNDVARFLQNRGFKIIPVNPQEKEILGEKCYPSLTSIPTKVDLVNVFRRAEDCQEVVKEALNIHAKHIWLQLGIISEQSREIAELAGVNFVMDHCIKIELMNFKDE
jgi:predicted CoA-binding protein